MPIANQIATSIAILSSTVEAMANASTTARQVFVVSPSELLGRTHAREG